MAGKRGQKEKIGLSFAEKMAGFLFPGEDFSLGEKRGEEEKRYVSFEVTITIEDIEKFCRISGKKAKLSGFISSRELGDRLPIRRGEFSLFVLDREKGQRRMTYSFCFKGVKGEKYFFYGYKIIHHDPQRIDFEEDLTTLFTRIYKGSSPKGEIIGSGIMRFRLSSLPAMFVSCKLTPAQPLWQKIRILSKFFYFCYGEIRDTYLAKLSPFYFTEYENLILTGRLRSRNGQENEFFFFSGVHDKDFPWGDGESFWDIALLIQQGEWLSFALTDRVIDGLSLDVEEGSYRYEGPLYQIKKGHQLLRSELKKKNLPPYLAQVKVKLEFNLDYERYATLNIPFGLRRIEKSLNRKKRENISEWLPHLQFLGFTLTPFQIISGEGKIEIEGGQFKEEYFLLPEKLAGEAEKATLQNLHWPKLSYDYKCLLTAQGDHIYLNLRTDILRKRHRDFRDKIEEALGQMVNKLVSFNLHLCHPKWSKISGNENLLSLTEKKILLEIINDHFPTGVLKRQVVEKNDPEGELYRGMEEETDPLNLGSINSEKIARVVAIKDPNKFHALKEVLNQTGFFDILEIERQKAKKSKEELAIIIKPNFMFMYSRNDPSTYTDPELIEYLIDQIYAQGYRNIACAESRSTYGTFFTNREVQSVANYIGLSSKNYRLIDLSEDLVEFDFPGKLGKHYVNREWKEADFRLAFAKNKTHSYAFYTLTIKDIYGALPLENKFLEYHHKRDIYGPTIEFIKHFPIHFALIDAYISADGPFGIFADKKPNLTQTIIGGADLVATDWIGASKMGLDPLVSDYMKKAVEAFGKPQIQLIGDSGIYSPWVNVSEVIPLCAFNLLDRHYYFGNLFYSVFSYMDEFFQYKDPGLGRKMGRVLAHPLKTLFFQKIEKGEWDEELNRKLFQMFSS